MKKVVVSIFYLKYFLLVVLLLLASLLNAQTTQELTNPTFEQTMNYIISNTRGRMMYPGALDAYSRVKGYILKDIQVEKSGKIVFITDQKYDINDFTITFNIFDLEANTEYPEGVLAKNFLVHFNGLNVTSGYGIVYATQNDALKIARAFRHLRAVCQKPQNELFDQPVIEEKKILGKAETISYINKYIKGGGSIGFKCSNCRTYEGRFAKDAFAGYNINSVELISPTKYIMRAIGGDCMEEFESGFSLTKVGSCDSKVDINFELDLKKFIGFETSNVYPKKTSLILNFETGSIKPSNYLPDIIRNKKSSMWSYSHIKVFIETENVERFKKAFEHLKALMIEEKKKADALDPFAN